MLSAFVRSNAPVRAYVPCPADPVALDVQAALTVLGRRDSAQDQNTRIELAQSCLPSVELKGANLVSADLLDTNLHHANLHTANLTT